MTDAELIRNACRATVRPEQLHVAHHFLRMIELLNCASTPLMGFPGLQLLPCLERLDIGIKAYKRTRPLHCVLEVSGPAYVAARWSTAVQNADAVAHAMCGQAPFTSAHSCHCRQ